MNQTEWRRKKLLEQTRNLYSDERTVPVVHPRYKMTYQQLYQDDYERSRGSFEIRMVICLVMFILYIVMEYSKGTVLGVDKMQVLEKIMQNLV